MSYTLACGDIVEGCAATFEADSEDGVLAAAGPHAAEVHGMTEMTPEQVDQVKAAIKTS